MGCLCVLGGSQRMRLNYWGYSKRPRLTFTDNVYGVLNVAYIGGEMKYFKGGWAFSMLSTYTVFLSFPHTYTLLFAGFTISPIIQAHPL